MARNGCGHPGSQGRMNGSIELIFYVDANKRKLIIIFKNILPGIQFNDKKYNKKLKHCWYMNRKKYL